MIKHIKHAINLIKHHFRDFGLKNKRSSQWPKVEKEFLNQYSKCEVCSSTKNLNVHHCLPFHLDQKLELDPTNLITLCMSTKECHLKIGHGDNFKAYNSNVRQDAKILQKDISKFNVIAEKAKENRLTTLEEEK